LGIRRVLLDVWDPIGIQNVPNAQDEYDSYLSGVLGLLVSGASDDELAAHLHHIVTETMGPNAPTEAMRDTVIALQHLK
jgi:hypothetical protein